MGSGMGSRRHACLELLELERIKVDPQGRSLSFPQPQLGLDYYEVIGWLEGFFNGWRYGSVLAANPLRDPSPING